MRWDGWNGVLAEAESAFAGPGGAAPALSPTAASSEAPVVVPSAVRKADGDLFVAPIQPAAIPSASVAGAMYHGIDHVVT